MLERPRTAACTRASSRSSMRRGTTPSRSSSRGRPGAAAARRARRHRRSAQRRRDPADRSTRPACPASCDRPGMRRRSMAPRRRRRPVRSRTSGRDGRQHRAGLEELKEVGVWTVGFDGDAAETDTTRWILRCRRRWSWARRGGAAEAGPRALRSAGRRSRWRAGDQPERVCRRRSGAVRGRPPAAARASYGVPESRFQL